MATYTLNTDGRPTLGPDLDGGNPSTYAAYQYLPSGLLSDATNWTLNSDLTTYSVGYVLHYDYDPNGATASLKKTYGPATSAFFNTLDVYKYDAWGAQVLDIQALAGSDGTVGTSDDQLGYTATSYDAQGNVTTIISGTKLNSDGLTIPLSAITSYSRHTLATASAPERFMFYSGAGPDGVFFTADDVLTSYSEITRDPRGNVQRVAFFDIPFGSPTGTAPTLSTYLVYTYDAHDNVVQRTAYTGPGVDGVWFTADDDVFVTATFDTTR